MKLTVVIENGHLVGAMKGHSDRPDTERPPSKGRGGDLRAGLREGPGQKIHEIEAPDELDKLDDLDQLHERLSALVRDKGLS